MENSNEFREMQKYYRNKMEELPRVNFSNQIYFKWTNQLSCMQMSKTIHEWKICKM